MNLLEAAFLGAVEGLTEFLPVSSTGHLTILEKLLGYSIDDPDITAFTAIIQVGAVFATLLYFRKDLGRILAVLLRGIVQPRWRGHPDYLFGWAVLLGSLPIGVVGLLFKDVIETTLRSLWFVGIALIMWSGVMAYADGNATQKRHEEDVTWKDTLAIGLIQCAALIPGISRSGATMSAGLTRGLDRVTVTRLSFFLSIPALFGAAALQGVSAASNISHGVGWTPTIIATLVSFAVAYVAIAWLLKFIGKNNYDMFIIYRIILGVAVLLLVGTGVVAAT
ncbi:MULTISPECIES: undecaprenyl-diphosphate phosphatase [unclassified Frankia]|uniref:undecaprenyl-diphosphate phosphatase n=1 Tax=unclassified Frankia TaxID=2632575 RepID=UPI001EF59E50|nr:MULTISPECIES: undecaprenyl-diphosphate phosphatase [unclassified Frankia]